MLAVPGVALTLFDGPLSLFVRPKGTPNVLARLASRFLADPLLNPASAVLVIVGEVGVAGGRSIGAANGAFHDG